MDTHQCLDFRSCHPSHFQRNIPFNMARRIYKTITAKTLRSKHLEELNIFLQRQKYSIKLIKEHHKYYACRFPNDSNNEGKLAFAVTHNPTNRAVLKDAERLYSILEQLENMKINYLRKSLSEADDKHRILNTC